MTVPSSAKPYVARHAPCAKTKWPQPSSDEFVKWFPGITISGTQTFVPRGAVLCFPSAGNAESMYTDESTGSRRSPSPLLDWCRENQVQMLAVQPPGRAQRIKEPQYWTLTDLAARGTAGCSTHLVPDALCGCSTQHGCLGSL
eukprot:jgi/Chrzof1/6088/Cz17g09080.t1